MHRPTLKTQRQKQILEVIDQEGVAQVLQLSKQFNVSAQTIRRDLDKLADNELILRDHGGAVSIQDKGRSILKNANDKQVQHKSEQEPPISSKSILAISQLIQTDQAIILEWTYLALALSQHLQHDLRALVITNSPELAMAFSKYERIEIRVIGGQLRNRVLIPTSVEELEFLQMTRADVCVLGPCALKPSIGITVSDSERAKVMRAMIANAAKVITMASRDNLDNATKFIVGPLNRLTHLVVDSSVTDQRLKQYLKLGIKIIRN